MAGTGYGVGGPPVGLNPAMALPEVNPLLAQWPGLPGWGLGRGGGAGVTSSPRCQSARPAFGGQPPLRELQRVGGADLTRRASRSCGEQRVKRVSKFGSSHKMRQAKEPQVPGLPFDNHFSVWCLVTTFRRVVLALYDDGGPCGRRAPVCHPPPLSPQLCVTFFLTDGRKPNNRLGKIGSIRGAYCILF